MRRGFSLIEVAITLAVVSFALIGIVGVLPVAMQQSRTCVDETRSAHLARLVFSTLQSEPFTAARCFSDDNSTVDLSIRDSTKKEAGKDSPDDVKLYASYDVRETVKVVRSLAPPPNAEYVLTLSFEPTQLSTTSAGAATPAPGPPPPPRGTTVRLTIAQLREPTKPVFLGADFIHRLKQGAGLK